MLYKNQNPLIILLLALLGSLPAGSASARGIDACYLSFRDATGLSLVKTDHLPPQAEKFRLIKTDSGEAQISRLDGYRIIYHNVFDAEFVNIKVEQSDPDLYAIDTQLILRHFVYMNSHSRNMETSMLIRLDVDGYTLWGVNRDGVDNENNIGTYVMFPGNGVVVYFYFNRIDPDYRRYNTLAEFKTLRDQFIKEYVRYIRGCS